MGFEQTPNISNQPSKEQPPYPGWVLKNGIWRNPLEEESTESIDQSKKDSNTEEQKNDDELRLTEKELRKISDKEYLNPDDLQKKKDLEIKYSTLDKETKETEKREPEKEKKEKENEGENKKVEKKAEKEKEKEITKRYYDELEKIKQMPDNTGKLKKEKVEKCFELITDWKDIAYLDNYKGIQNIFSELNKSKPSIFLYDLKKAETIDEVAIAMASDYEKWDLEDKKKLKTIKSFVNKQSEERNFWYEPDDRDKTFKDIAQILSLKDIPFKGSVDVIVEDIKNPNIKSEAIAKIFEIKKETIEEKKKLLKETKEKTTKEKIPDGEKIKEQFEKIGASPEIMKIFENPESLSRLFTKGSEILKNPEIQKKIQELQTAIEKATKEKGIIPDSITKAAEFIKGGKKEKESPWKTSFGAIGWSILLFLVLFVLAELKGIDYLSGQATGKKKEK